jgi:predicted SAM-dependent methyltransferase
MKRLQLATSRFEKLLPQTIEVMADSTWTHLGEPETSWKTQFQTAWQLRDWYTCASTLYRALKPRYTHEQLKAFYAKTDFKPFNYDMGNQLQFGDNTFDFVYSEHFFEHLFTDEAVALLTECYRILKPNGVVRIVVPDADLRTYEQPESIGFPNSSVPWSHPDKHKTRWSIYSLPLTLKAAGLVSRPIMYCDKYGKLAQSVPSASDSEYAQSEDKDFLYSIKYIRRIPSLICDGIKVTT